MIIRLAEKGARQQAVLASLEDEFGPIQVRRLWQWNATAHAADLIVIHFEDNVDWNKAAAFSAADAAVEYAEPNWIGSLCAVPTDPLYAQQQNDLNLIGIEAAWDAQAGSDASVRVAVIDSGVDAQHADLAAALNTALSYNFIDGNTSVIDDLGHGTRVAGLIGATADNGEGISGIAPGCTLISYDVVDPNGQVTVANVANALSKAVADGVTIANMSLRFDAVSITLEQACQDAADAGVLLIAGAGNDNQGSLPVYPASYSSVLGVGAIRDDGISRAPWSNYDGTESTIVSLVAPGETVYATTPGSQYNGTFGSGTSFAAPMVAGVAALLKAQNPDQSMAAIGAHILDTCTPEPAGFAPTGGAGAGVLNAAAALSNEMQAKFSIETVTVDDSSDDAPNAAWDKGETVRLAPRLQNTGGDARSLTATLSTIDPYVTISDASASWDHVKHGEELAPGGDGFQVAQTADAPARKVAFSMELTGSAAWLPVEVVFNVDSRSLYQFPSPILVGDVALTADTTYLFPVNTVLFDGATLTIEPGTTLRFAPDVKLELRGTVTAEGTKEAPILFTSQNGEDISWQGLWLRTQVPAASFLHCTFQFGPVKDETQVAKFSNCLFDRTGGNYSYEGAFGPAVELAPSDPLARGDFGRTVSAVPDITGDDLDDVVVGAPDETGESGLEQAGRVYVYDAWTGEKLHEISSPGEEHMGHFGASVSGLADATGDSRGDILVGAPYEGEGRAYVFDGSSGALVHTISPPAGQSWGEFGCSVSGIADITGDSQGDLLVAGTVTEEPSGGMGIAGGFCVFSGSTGVFVRGFTAPFHELFSTPSLAVSEVSDVTGDGRSDMVMGEAYYSSGQSSAHIFDATAGTLLNTLTPSDPSLGLEFATSVAGVPDINGDGRGDVAVGAGANYIGGGQVDLFDGATGELLRTLVPPVLEIGLQSNFGTSVAGIPDVSGDGRGDVIVSAPYSSGMATYIMDGATGLPVFVIPMPEGISETSFGASVSALFDSENNAPVGLVVGAPGDATTSGRVFTFRLGAPIVGCVAQGNQTGGGFRAAAIDGSLVMHCDGIGFSGNTVTSCIATGNSGDGISALVVTNSEAHGNGARGIGALNSAAGCDVSSNAGIGIEGGALFNCSAKRNGSIGLSANRVDGSLSRLNHGAGIVATGSVTGSLSEDNDGAGIQAESIDGSIAVRNSSGLMLSGESSNCYIAENEGTGVTGGSLATSAVIGHPGGGVQSCSAVTDCSMVGNDGFGSQDVEAMSRCMIAYNEGKGASLVLSITDSIITGNADVGLDRVDQASNSHFENNGEYDVYEIRPSDQVQQTDFQGNYWGVETTAEIEAPSAVQLKNLSRIYDFFDDMNLGLVDFRNHLSSPPPGIGPDDSAPALLLHITPDSHIATNVGATTFTLTFSEAMNTVVPPAVTFGREAPYDSHVVDSDPGWLPDRRTWQGRFWVQTDTGDGEFHVRVSQARSVDGFDIPDDTFRTFRIDFGAPVANAGAALGGKRMVTVSWQGNGLEYPRRGRSIPRGFHILRSRTGEVGTFERINAALLPPDTREYTDTNLEPGMEYFYMVFLVDDNYDAVQWIPPVAAKTEAGPTPSGWAFR